MVVRQYDDELKYIEKINDYSYRIKKGFQPNMNVEGVFYVNKRLETLMFEELKNACRPGMDGGFLPGLCRIYWIFTYVYYKYVLLWFYTQDIKYSAYKFVCAALLE